MLLSKYITFSNCKFKRIRLRTCFELEFENVNTNLLELETCKKILIKKCSIGELRLNKTDIENLKFEDSRIGYTRIVKKRK